ncbi:hypothetical protein [Ramlibacter albus]|uniref:Uncharacterized protein n=1 Tax=Ramlibacter albus TaxID=2079448 RepID=A0A923M9J1_9BURK|nr:hypothetical protein [Ramlibacter albus]MBC5765254.1 hypothetical protein [Ramlibacter albus]
MNASTFRHDGSTRGFCTTDPERQGVFPSASRFAVMQAFQAPATSRLTPSQSPLSAARPARVPPSQARPAGQ